ncbi:hypothetical protein Poli38472_009299 [Pythium oligandrum]|uniref:Uncharacterized protein n=1 Tax=Pythium oligandrum TaxID=41045 RepID=A0A8K1FMR4_PYTOL|nr:hypothetical protein Poli38472_009299 [Pythium oligandrum]|eukprot:TMW65132.1 hypothetical protein Poli38472_009299 [Pythium oligandrum]
MEAVRPKQKRKNKPKASATQALANEEDGAVLSPQARGAADGARVEVKTLVASPSEDEMDELAMERMLAQPSATDEEIEHNENDLFAFLGADGFSSGDGAFASYGASPGESKPDVRHTNGVVVASAPAFDFEPTPMEAVAMGASSSIGGVSAASTSSHSQSAMQSSTIEALPTTVNSPSMLHVPSSSTLTMTAAPSAPNFDDSDDEDLLSSLSISRPPETQEAVEPAQGSVVPEEAPSQLPDTQDSTEPAQSSVMPEQFRPTAPPEPSESPEYRGDSGAITSTVPSAPLEEDDIQEHMPTPQHVEVPSAPEPTEVSDDSRTETSATSSTTRVVKNVSKEEASAAVRSSFAKILKTDSAGRLYPDVVPAVGVTTGLKPANGRLEQVSAPAKQKVFIKLDPYSNFEMNLLKAAASQKRQEAKMHNIEINKGDLYSRLERYLYAEYLLQSASSTMDSRKKEIDTLSQKVWLIETKRLSASKRCGDQIEIEEVLEFQTAKFDASQLDKLKEHLEKLRQLRTVESCLYTFDRALSYFHVEQYLNEVTQEPDLVSHLNKMTASGVSRSAEGLGEFETVPAAISFYEPLPGNSKLTSSVDHLKYCIDVLIFFEKQVTVDERGIFGRVPPSFSRGELMWHTTGRSMSSASERRVRCYACGCLNMPMEPSQWCRFCESCGVVLYLPPSSISTKSSEWYTATLRFRQSLQKWITFCLRNLLRLRSLVNMPYVLMHVMYLPRISTEERSWVLRFLQFPKAVVSSTGELKREWSEDLVDHYLAMLHLVFHPEKLRRLAMLVSSEPSSRQKSADQGRMSPEWVLLENPDMLDRCYLSDEDFVAVLNQFPNQFALEQLFNCTLDAKKSFSRALALVVEFTQGLRLFQEFEKFPARVAQLLGDVLSYASLVPAASSSVTRDGNAIVYPTLFDQLFLTALHGLLVADCNRVAWRSIRNFPFAPLSDLAKWDVLALLLFGVHQVPDTAKNHAGWVEFIDRTCIGGPESTKRARSVLYSQIVSDADNAMHLLHAAARLAASTDDKDLVRVATNELFLAGYADIECRRVLGESGERAAGPISTICLAHPWVISELISLLFKYHECAETWIHVFETFPVNRWLPSVADLTNLQEWLLLETSAPRNALARFLLDRINWDFDAKEGKLFTSPYLHRQVALVVAEALVSYHARRRNEGGEKARSSTGSVVSPPKFKVLTKSLRRVLRLEPTVDFEQWCWRLMLKLKFYSPLTHHPFIDLVDLKQDRSREALLLRRWFPGAVSTFSLGGKTVPFFGSLDQLLSLIYKNGVNVSSMDLELRAALAGVPNSGSPIQEEEDGAAKAEKESDDPELESTVAVISTCEAEPIVAYLVCQMSTFLFTDRIDRWEPLLILLKNNLFNASVKVLESVLPLVAKLERAKLASTLPEASQSDEAVVGKVDHDLSACMAVIESLSTDQLLQLVQAMRRHSYISMDELHLLSDLLQKGYIVLQVPFWFEHPALRHLVDVVLRCSMQEAFAASSSSGGRKQLQVRLVSILQQSFVDICQDMKHEIDLGEESNPGQIPELPPAISFLPADQSSPALASIFGGGSDAAQFVGGCSVLSFWALLTETRQELPLFMALGELLVRFEPTSMKKVEKIKKTEGKMRAELMAVGFTTASKPYSSVLFAHTTYESLSQYRIYRWAEYCLMLPEDDELQILYWQVLFALYYACTGGTKVFGHWFFAREESKYPKRIQLRKNLQLKLRSMTTYCSNQAQLVLTNTGSAGGMTSEGKDRRYHHYVQLSHIYTAMDTWLEEQDPNKWLKDEELSTLPRHFEVGRLRDVLNLSDCLLNTPPGDFRWSGLPLWTELCGFEFAAPLRVIQPAGEDTTDEPPPPSTEHLHEEDFAFIEDSKDFRRHSSLGSSADHGRTSDPLALTAEYSGPSSLTLLPHVTVEIRAESCVITPSIPLNKQGLKTLAMKFSENLSILVGLDAEILDHISKLYSSKPRTITESKPCIEGSNCRSPAAFRFEFTEWTIDNHLSDTIESTLSQAARYEMKSMSAGAIVPMSNLDYGDHTQHSGLLSNGVDEFLRLDADGLMLSMQILLIDQLVQVLDHEVEKTKRRTEVASASTTEEDESEDKQVQDTEKEAARLHEKGLEWFRQLTELDTKLSRMVPPLREVLWRSIKQLGITFVCVDERETYNLLQLMLDDPSRIMLLSECFSPASAPSRFVEMFSSLMSASSASKLSSEDKLTLLRRFDFKAWLQTKAPHTPTKFDRDTILCIVLGDIGKNFEKDGSLSGGASSRRQDTNEVLQVYAQIVHMICSAHLGDHLEKVLHALVGVQDDYRFNTVKAGAQAGENEDGDPAGSLPKPLAAAIWESVIKIPPSIWQQIPFVQVEACISFMSQHMSSLRMQASTVTGNENAPSRFPLGMWQRSGVLKHYLDLFTLLWKSSPESQKWPLILTFFEPLLSTLYMPATTMDSSSICGPWSEQDSLSTGTTLCSCFVAVCTEYLKTKGAADEGASSAIDPSVQKSQPATATVKLDRIWNFYVTTLIANSPVYVCKSFHQFLTRLGWEHWCLRLEIVQQMRELVQTEKQQLALSSSCPDMNSSSTSLSTYPYVSWIVRDILCRMTWKATEEWLSGQNEAIRSVFTMDLVKLCIELILDYPHFQSQQSKPQRGRSGGSSANVLPPYFVNFIKQQPAVWMKWKMNSSELDSLLGFAVDAVLEPLRDLSGGDNSSRVFSTGVSPAVMQDAFTRLQLILRVMNQVTSVHHKAMTRKENLNRSNRFLRSVFQIFDTGYSSSVGDFGDKNQAGWQLVLFGATCTVLYEKLDEIVQACRNGSGSPGTGGGGESVSEEDLLDTVIEVQRLYNLRLVEPFFKAEQADGGSKTSLNWGKCGNVIFVEVDSLIRDFTSSQKSGMRVPVPIDSLSDDDMAMKPSSSPVDAIGNPLGRLLWSFMGFRGGELSSLAACGRAIASVQVMSLVAEKSIEKWIIEERRGTWDDLVARLRVPELSEDEFESACLQQGNLLTLQVLFLQQLRKAPAMTEAFAMGMLSKLMSWMHKMPLISSTNTLTEMKILFFAAEVTNFVFRILADVLPAAHKKQALRDLCNLMLQLGNARRQHGIMKAIGIGGSLKYNVEFHVCSLTIGIFLRLQTRNGAPLRVDERIPYKLTRTTEKHLKSLEQLLTSKNCFQLQKRMEWMLDFLKSPSRSLADLDEFVVSLFSRIYPSHPWLLAKCISA